MYILACLGVFLAAYLVNTLMITVFYHRGLAHRAVTLRPWARKLTIHTGIWCTGLDPKGWACMHRRHHAHSDTAQDPHSPLNLGVWGVLLGQLKSYQRTLVGLARGKREFTRHVEDLDFPISWLNRKRVWYLPYLTHLAISLTIALPTGMWALGAAYYFGIMSHPIEGWIVNSLGHAVGSRNFEISDNSRNNHLAAWLVFGEGYQNNHHRYATSAKFSYQRWEVDLGYGLCLLLEKLGVLDIRRDTLIPSPAAVRAAQAQGLAEESTQAA
jgi:stearoyl-CoA desaturase (delta-9 desaturase)